MKVRVKDALYIEADGERVLFGAIKSRTNQLISSDNNKYPIK